jgi:hypothetical protein
MVEITPMLDTSSPVLQITTPEHAAQASHEIIRRMSETPGETSVSPMFRPFDLTAMIRGVEDFFAGLIAQTSIKPSHGTTLACTKCGALNAPAYYLKRSHGRYAVLCFNNGDGCWEHSSNSNCSYVDQYMSQCMDLAEWVVAYGEDMLKERHVCSIHVAAVLSDSAVHKVFPIQD